MSGAPVDSKPAGETVDETADATAARVARAVERAAQQPGAAAGVPAQPASFDAAEVAAHAARAGAFWAAATDVLHAVAAREHAVALVAALLDLAVAVHRQSGADSAVPLFALQEEAFLVLPLGRMRDLLAFLELRRGEWVAYAQGEASIVLLRTGRAVLNRLEPRLHARDAGRVIAYLALSKGLAHPSRLNRKGLLNPAGATSEPAGGSAANELTIERAVVALQDAAALARSPELEPFLASVLQRLTRLTLEPPLAEATAWAGLTWEQAEKTLNGLVFVLVVLFAVPTLKRAEQQGAARLVERIEDRVDRLVASTDLTAAVERLAAREDEWSAWRQNQYARPERAPAELPPTADTAAEAADKAAEQEPAAGLSVPPLAPSLGNPHLTQLWSVHIGLDRFEESVDWAARASQFASTADSDATAKFLALRCRPWSELVPALGSTPAPAHDLTEWEAKLPKSPPAAPERGAPERGAPKRASEPAEPAEPAPKRARMSYEDAEYPSAVDRQRAMASTARPLPY